MYNIMNRNRISCNLVNTILYLYLIISNILQCNTCRTFDLANVTECVEIYDNGCLPLQETVGKWWGQVSIWQANPPPMISKHIFVDILLKFS